MRTFAYYFLLKTNQKLYSFCRFCACYKLLIFVCNKSILNSHVLSFFYVYCVLSLYRKSLPYRQLPNVLIAPTPTIRISGFFNVAGLCTMQQLSVLVPNAWLSTSSSLISTLIPCELSITINRIKFKKEDFAGTGIFPFFFSLT